MSPKKALKLLKGRQEVLPDVPASEAVTAPLRDSPEEVFKKVKGRYIMIYSDPMTQQLSEGLAQVVEVSHTIPLERGFIMVYATVHFKKDPKWARNERKFMMRG